ncbi:hypothetical protein SAY86_001621 [Trapa natans]|uniref:RNase H type-1 domain-containing protein n=1 Tax=Trapa natans TaxID=22666 RepID=A0AAN7LE78_TRANT|nr:hypothetical protein SAY86_001621 [Trapa natans]
MLLIEPVWNEPRRRLDKEPPADAWIRPPIETVKNSCDGSFSTKLEPAVVGILARDHSSRVLFGGGKQVLHRHSLEVEGAAILFRAQLTKELRIGDVILETDSSEVFRRITWREKHSNKMLFPFLNELESGDVILETDSSEVFRRITWGEKHSN